MPENDLIKISRRIHGALRKIILYKSDHPTVKKDIMETCHLLNTFLSREDSFSLNIIDERFFINEYPMDNNEPCFSSLKKNFRKLAIESATFTKGLKPDELLLFFKILIAIPESLKKAGGIKGVLDRGKSTHLKINEERYARVGEDQVVADRGTYEIEDKGEKYFEIGVEEEIVTADLFEKEILEEIKKLSGSSADTRKIFKEIMKNFREEMERATEGLKREKRRVEFEKKRTESVIRSMSDGVVVVDDKGKILMMNPAAEKIMECEKGGKVGTPIAEGIKEHQMVSISRAFKEGERQNVKEFNIEGSEDTQRTVRDSMAVVENEDGKTVGMVSVLTDITKQKDLDNMKSEFLAKVTHELRTPLAAIKQTISMILGQTVGAVSEAQKKFLTIARNNIERLNRLVNNILDLSKLESGKMELKNETGEIGEVLMETISTFRIWAAEKGIPISSDRISPVPAFSFDRDKIIQVATNLLSNALKFTPKKGEISISAIRLEEERSIKVSVEDSGIGIAKDDLDKIFDKFVQVGKKGVSEIKGTGLGLPIVKEIVELHGGKIWAESPVREEGGTRFSFTLPVR